MNQQHIQNEKTLDDVINKHVNAQNPELKKQIDENMQLRNKVDKLEQENRLLIDRNTQRDHQMEDMLQRVMEMRRDMAQEIDSFTRVNLQMEVLKFQNQTYQNLMRQHSVEVPSEYQELLDDLSHINQEDLEVGNILESQYEDSALDQQFENLYDQN